MIHSIYTSRLHQLLRARVRSVQPITRENKAILKLDNLESRDVQGSPFNAVSAFFAGRGPMDPMQSMGAALGDLAMTSRVPTLPTASASQSSTEPLPARPITLSDLGHTTQPTPPKSTSESSPSSNIPASAGSTPSTDIGDFRQISLADLNPVSSSGSLSQSSSPTLASGDGGLAVQPQSGVTNVNDLPSAKQEASEPDQSIASTAAGVRSSRGLQPQRPRPVQGTRPPTATFVTPPPRDFGTAASPTTLGILSGPAAVQTATNQILAVGSDAGAAPRIKVYDAATQSLKFTISPFANSFQGGVRVAVADVDGDGMGDVVASQGPGGTNQVKVFSGVNGNQLTGAIGSFTAFPTSQANGVYVAAADTNGDGRSDIALGTDGAFTPQVKVVSGSDASTLKTIDLSYLGLANGVRVGAGDITGNGLADVVVAGGPGGTSRVVVFDSSNYSEKYNFFAFDSTDQGGVNLAVGDFNGDAYSDIVTGQASGGSWVNVFSGSDSSYLARVESTPGFTGGVRVGMVDANQNGLVDLVVGQGPTGNNAKILSSPLGSQLVSWTPFNNSNGMFVAGDTRPAPGGFSILSVTPTVTVSATTAAAQEGNNLVFTLTRDDTSTAINVALAYSGSATFGTDFSGMSSIPLPIGQATATVIVTTTADSTLESNETVVATIQPQTGYTVGSPSVAVGSILDSTGPLDTPVNPPCGCGGATTTMGVDGNAGISGGIGSTSSGIRAADGVIVKGDGDLNSFGFGKGWGADRTWTNSPAYIAAGSGYGGNGVVAGNVPYLRSDGTRIVVISAAGSAEYFDLSGGSYVARNFSKNLLTYNSGTKLFTYKDSNGNVGVYYDFDATRQAAEKGRMKTFTDSDGNVVDSSASTATGKPSEITKTSGSNIESYLYTYLTSGTNSGKISNITLRRSTNSGSSYSTVRQVDYTYYDTGSTIGTAGDLKLAVVKDSSGSVIDTKYYRYFTTSSATGYAGALKYSFDAESYERLNTWVVANSLTPDTASDAQVAVYASDYYEYDSGRRVTTHTQQGNGCSSCFGGLSTTTLAYTTSAFGNGYNSWRTKTVETLPDGTVNTVFTNYVGQVMLSVVQPTGSSSKWITFNKYDTNGRLILSAQPSAITGYDETKADLLSSVSGNYSFMSDSAGLVQTISYYDSLSSPPVATATTAGKVLDYLNQTSIKQGENGTAVVQSTQDYFSRTDSNGVIIYPVANITRYRAAASSGPQTTSFSYAWAGTTLRPDQITTTLPIVLTAQNGSNSAETSVVANDSRGRPIWTKDGGGFLTYTEYDDVTGAVTKTIRDVDTAQTSTFTNKPTGWTTPSGGGLHQTTNFEVDVFGRTTKVTDPNGNITYTTYNDITHETRTYAGWDTTTNLPTGPTMVSREDRARGYSETLTMSATPTVTGGRPTGTETISGVLTLSRSVLNAAGQPIYQDQYFNLTGVTYSQTTATLGTANTNYYRTETSFDKRGRVERTLTPSGTIYRSVFDGLNRTVSTWVGTDDTPTTGFWSPTNLTGTDTVQLTANEYDGNGVGDSNLTRSIQYPGGGAAVRNTDYYYDWRNRLVATKSGVEASESTSVNRPISYTEYDNLGEAIASEMYDGDGITLTSTAGVPNRPSASLLRAKSTTDFDEQGRGYQSSTFSVDISTGSVSTNSLKSNQWYNTRGMVMKSVSPGGLVSKNEFDGLGRTTKNYDTDGGGDTAYADAGNVTGDAVLSQSEMTYDIGDRLLLVTSKERFHDETATGALGNVTTAPKARVSYLANYYDKANRTTDAVSVGTNGGATYSRPSTVPARSDTTLVNSTSYNASGWVDTTTDPRGLLAKKTYDNLGRVTRSVENYVDGTVSDADDKTVDYTFANNGQMATLKAYLTGGSYQETKWVFGITSPIVSNDILKEMQYPDPTTGNASSSQKDAFTYNQLSQVLTKTDRNGTVHTLTFDTLGRVTIDTVTTLGSGVDGAVRRVETAYDGQGNAYLITSYDATTAGSIVNQIQREFNGLGQMTKEYQSVSGAVNTGTTPNVQYAYSFAPSGSTNHSRLTTLTYPNGRALTYNYSSGLNDNISRLSSITDGATTLESYDYLGLGIVVNRAHAQTGVDLRYTTLNSEPNGTAGDKYAGLDAFGRVVDQRWSTTGVSPVASDRFGYAYDRDSNRLYKENLLSSTNSELYAYDGLNQVTSMQRGTLNAGKTGLTGSAARSQSWAFDSLGNFNTQTTDGTAQTRTHNKQNEILTVSSATSPTYDSNGNLTKDETGRQFVYDAWNRLKIVKNSGGTTLATYKWDGLGRRTTETRGATVTDLYYSSQWQVLEERVGGTARISYAWSPVYVDALIARDRDSDNNGSLEERLYVVQDANFNVTALIDTAGTVQERYQYDVFGGFTVLTGAWGSRASSSYAWKYLHQGGRWDSDGGVYSFRNREMSPTLGRWLQVDSLGLSPDNDMYRYIANNAGGSLDPIGEEVTSANLTWDDFRTLPDNNIEIETMGLRARDGAAGAWAEIVKYEFFDPFTGKEIMDSATGKPQGLASINVLENNTEDATTVGLEAKARVRWIGTFNKEKSWKRESKFDPKSDIAFNEIGKARLLAHEKVHLLIAETFAWYASQRLRICAFSKVQRSTAAARAALRMMIGEQLDSITKKLDAIQVSITQAYDKQTGSGADRAQQALWSDYNRDSPSPWPTDSKFIIKMTKLIDSNPDWVALVKTYGAEKGISCHPN